MNEEQANDLLRILKALADGSRLKILGLLSDKEMNVAAIAAELGLSEPTISHHLNKLVAVDLVSMRQAGTNHFYALNSTNLRKFQQSLGVVHDNTADSAPANSNTEEQRILKSFVVDGRLVKIPEMLKKRRVILQWLVNKLEPDRRYTEREISVFLKQFHPDFATLRRELIDRQYMLRENAIYWRI